jgi:hypothetical protein
LPRSADPLDRDVLKPAVSGKRVSVSMLGWAWNEAENIADYTETDATAAPDTTRRWRSAWRARTTSGYRTTVSFI